MTLSLYFEEQRHGRGPQALTPSRRLRQARGFISPSLYSYTFHGGRTSGFKAGTRKRTAREHENSREQRLHAKYLQRFLLGFAR